MLKQVIEYLSENLYVLLFDLKKVSKPQYSEDDVKRLIGMLMWINSQPQFLRQIDGVPIAEWNIPSWLAPLVEPSALYLDEGGFGVAFNVKEGETPVDKSDQQENQLPIYSVKPTYDEYLTIISRIQGSLRLQVTSGKNLATLREPAVITGANGKVYTLVTPQGWRMGTNPADHVPIAITCSIWDSAQCTGSMGAFTNGYHKFLVDTVFSVEKKGSNEGG